MYKHLILITGMPRSGTSWLSQIFDSSPDVCFRLSPLFSYEFKNCVNEQSSRADWEQLLAGTYHSRNEFMNQTARRVAGEYPVFKQKEKDPQWLVLKDTRFHDLTERMLQLFDNLKIVAIVRNPCGSIHSWLTAPREFPPTADPMQEWRTGKCRKTGYGEFWGFEDWKSVTRLHLRLAQAFPDNLIVQRYEDLVRERTACTQRLFQFCGLEYSDQTESFLQLSGSTHVQNEYAVFKHPTVADRWRKEINPRIQQEIIEELRGSDLERFLE